MAKIKVTCDSTCDLTKELYESYNVHVIGLGVNMGDDFRRDGVDVTAQELFEYVDKSGQLPKTSAISIGTYEDVFSGYVNTACSSVFADGKSIHIKVL